MCRFIYFMVTMALVTGVTLADEINHCGVPVDSEGSTIPAPNGNIPFLKMPDALCAGDKEFTWDYSGTLENADQRFSFQGGMAQLMRGESSGLGVQEFYFGFQDSDAYFYSNSTYGGENQALTSAAQTLNTITSSASLDQLSIHSSLLANPSDHWSMQSYGKPISQAPLYKGFVGQPGHQYQLTGNGSTFLWRYDKKTGQSSVIPYRYRFNLILLDERGATMEGLGGGYVGPSLVSPVSTAMSKTFQVESEIAQPRLKVLSWQVTMEAVNKTAPGFQGTYDFSGNNGMLWDDFGPLLSAHTDESQSMQQMGQQKSVNTQALYQQVTEVGAASLYNGSWIPIQFTSGKYAGATLAFSVFWDKSERYSTDQTTRNKTWSTVGWVNYFSGLIPGRVESNDTMLETLYPENPAPPSTTSYQSPYEVKFNQFVPDQFKVGFPWVQSLTVTIKANTKLRYALAAYATMLAGDGADDPSKELIIKITAINPVTQNTLFSSTVSQFYEGAAVPTIDDVVVGYAWIEQMVK